MTENILNQIGNWNPQLFREIKGRFNQKNIIIATLVSLVGQILILAFLQAQLPNQYQTFHRYCVGVPPADLYNQDYYYGYSQVSNYCVRDDLGNIIHLFHQLWWLDLFIALSLTGVFVLLVGGTYLLIADLSKEENKGTLNFIRLSPQSAKSIFIGKMLGVPSLIYYACLLAIPFHLIAGIIAKVSLPLIFVFYLVTIFACIFFYHAALLYGLVSSNLMGFQSFLGSAIVLFFLACSTSILMGSGLIIHNPIDWLTIFNPGAMLPYLVDTTNIQPNTIYFLKLSSLQELQFYGVNLWQNLASGVGFVIFNYALWSYWLSQGLKRRFHNPLTTLITKKQGYGITACFAFMNLGFILQSSSYSYLYDNFTIGLFFNLVLFLILSASLSPHRQELQDWSRYRHYTPQRRNLLQELIFSEKSPSTLAIALNIAMVSLYFIPAVLIFPIYEEEKIPLILGIILCGIIALLYVTIAQYILYLKTPKRTLWAGVVISTMMILPYIILGMFNLSPGDHWLWLLTMLPVATTKNYVTGVIIFSLLGQISAIALFHLSLSKKLQQAGRSETKALLAH